MCRACTSCLPCPVSKGLQKRLEVFSSFHQNVFVYKVRMAIVRLHFKNIKLKWHSASALNVTSSDKNVSRKNTMVLRHCCMRCINGSAAFQLWSQQIFVEVHQCTVCDCFYSKQYYLHFQNNFTYYFNTACFISNTWSKGTPNTRNLRSSHSCNAKMCIDECISLTWPGWLYLICAAVAVTQMLYYSLIIRNS